MLLKYSQNFATGVALILLFTGCPSNSRQSAKKSIPAIDAERVAKAHKDDSPKEPKVPSEPKTAAVSHEKVATDSRTSVPTIERAGDGDALPKEVAETWTKQRLIVLANGGPLILDISVNVDGRSMEDAFQVALVEIAKDLKIELASMVAWKDLLSNPLIKSGWLGNLVSSEDQTEQILNLYDTARDNQADKNELLAFLTRGLSRNPRLNITEATDDAGGVESSTFGPCDANSDGELDSEEVKQLERALLKSDFNGDLAISRNELAPNSAMNNPLMVSAGTSFIDQATIFTWSLADISASASRVMNHYTFLDQMPRENWFAWPQSRLQQLDLNSDSLLSPAELKNLGEISSDAQLFARIATVEQQGSSNSMDSSATKLRSLEMNIGTTLAELKAVVWATQKSNTGRLATPTCVLHIGIESDWGVDLQKLFDERLRQSLDNTQSKMAFASQLDLQPTAVDFLDANSDAEFSAAEVAAAWRWYSTFRKLRQVGRWRTSTAPWFELIDRDQNDSLTQFEVVRFSSEFSQFDRDKDSRIAKSESPLVARLSLEDAFDTTILRRSMARNQVEEKPEVNAPKWFSAMDSNQDGGISSVEFLGGSVAFAEFDVNKDGVISPIEVYEPR